MQRLEKHDLCYHRNGIREMNPEHRIEIMTNRFNHTKIRKTWSLLSSNRLFYQRRDNYKNNAR